MPTENDLNSILMVDSIEDGAVTVTPVKVSMQFHLSWRSFPLMLMHHCLIDIGLLVRSGNP